jgi:hypothetical protein
MMLRSGILVGALGEAPSRGAGAEPGHNGI